MQTDHQKVGLAMFEIEGFQKGSVKRCFLNIATKRDRLPRFSDVHVQNLAMFSDVDDHFIQPIPFQNQPIPYKNQPTPSSKTKTPLNKNKRLPSPKHTSPLQQSTSPLT